MNHTDASTELRRHINIEKAEFLPRYFKTGKGQYGEGDKFLGIVVPDIRKVAKEFSTLDMRDIEILLDSEWHEERMLALLILVERFNRHAIERKDIFDFYINNTKRINNWDLVDLSCGSIVGHYVYDHREYTPVIIGLSRSDYLFDRRIAIVSCSYLIDNGEAEPCLSIIKDLLPDKHDLIQKASGWMLREIYSKIDTVLAEYFIKTYYQQIPRTTLRYAIEKMDEVKRHQFLSGKIDLDEAN